MYILVSIFFHVTVKFIFQRSYCAFSKSSLSLTQSRVNLYPLSSTKFFKRSSSFNSLSTQIFFGRLFFLIMDKKAFTISWESFVLIPLAFTVLSNKSWRTSKHFTPLFYFADLSTWAKLMHQIAFLNLAKALILLKFCVARLNFV